MLHQATQPLCRCAARIAAAAAAAVAAPSVTATYQSASSDRLSKGFIRSDRPRRDAQQRARRDAPHSIGGWGARFHFVAVTVVPGTRADTIYENSFNRRFTPGKPSPRLPMLKIRREEPADIQEPDVPYLRNQRNPLVGRDVKDRQVVSHRTGISGNVRASSDGCGDQCRIPKRKREPRAAAARRTF